MDGYTKSRVDNVMQMYRGGSLETPSTTGQPRVAYILCQYAEELESKIKEVDYRCAELTDANMKKLCYIEELWNRSLLQTLKDWWRWLPSRKLL